MIVNRRLVLGFLLAICPALAAQDGTSPRQSSGATCFAPTLEEAQAHALQLPLAGRGDCSLANSSILAEYEPENGFVYKIPVVWHVIHASDGTGNINRSFIDSQMKVLNEDFNALPGTNGENGRNARIWFYLADEAPDGSPTNGIDRVQNNPWFNVGPTAGPPFFPFFPALAWDTNRYLNIYTKRLPQGLLGGASLPQAGVVGTPNDWIVLSYRYVGRPSINGGAYDLGRTATHEVGHWLGLVHTFQGGCGSADCYRSGDLLCDTRPQAAPVFGCPGAEVSCGGIPVPVENHMGYANDVCKERFTPEQVNRMRCTLSNWRPDIHRPLCAAPSTTTMRSAAPNLDSYLTSPAELGTGLSFTIDTRPYDFAIVMSRTHPAQTTLPGGQVLLIDLVSPSVCSSGVLPGPDATFDFLVPLDPGLCGLAVYSQAALFGGPAPFALTNAIDFVIGG